jgi:PIN domain nuclease of toxin-antitoxin system
LSRGLAVDTHSVLWYLADDPALSGRAAVALDETTSAGQPIYLPAICLVEAIYLSEKGKIPASALDQLLRVIEEPGGSFVVAALDANIAVSIRNISRVDVPDLPDRVIAATAVAVGVPLVTKDRRIRAAQVETIW